MMIIKFPAALVGGCVIAVATVGSAGPYAGISGVTPGAPDNPIPRSAFTTFESSVVNYSPAPGVGAGFQNYQSGIASLGDLYSPVPSPTGSNTPFNKIYAPQTGTEPNSFHDGSAVFSPFDGNVNDPNDTYGFIGVDQPGSITLGFGNNKIVNGPGADFAVFENGFQFPSGNNLLAELAYVEVSSDGTDFARFPSVSLNTAATAVSGSFQGYDMTNVYDLAGKNAANWGTPFDLSELANNPLVTAGLLNLNDVRYVRLVDVVGSGQLFNASGNVIPGIARDSLGNPILDNWITYDSAGFDYLGLNVGSVGVVHSAPVPEPATLAIGITGFVTAALVRLRRRVRSSRGAN
jgi:hypothetical protein